MLPKSTNAEPRLAICCSGSWKISFNLASDKAAVSDESRVATPSFAIVSINTGRPLDSIPNWPPSSPIAFNSLVATGSSKAMSLMDIAKVLNSLSEASTVFLIPANESSNLDAAPTPNNNAAPIPLTAPTTPPIAPIWRAPILL